MSTMKSLKLEETDNKTALFKPTPHMEKFVETAVELGSDDITAIAKECGIDRTAYYKWKRNPEFSTWMNEYAGRLIKGDGWKLNNIGMRKSKQDHRYWESMQKIVGNITETNQTNIQNNIVVKIEDY